MEISFQPGDEIHVLSRYDGQGNRAEWWKGYVAKIDMQGPPRIGMFPGNFVELTLSNPEVPQRPSQISQGNPNASMQLRHPQSRTLTSSAPFSSPVPSSSSNSFLPQNSFNDPSSQTQFVQDFNSFPQNQSTNPLVSDFVKPQGE